MRHAYPLMLDVSQRLIVIVGGGAVGARKARGLLDAGASRVRVISPSFCDDMPAGVERITEPYAARHLAEAELVFAATGDQAVNAEVVREARRLGVLVSRADADDQLPSDFTTPAVYRDGDLTITVSAAGSPALAAAVRDRLQAHVQPKWVKMAQMAQTYRPYLIERGAAPELRRAVFRDLASDEAMNVLDSGGVDGLSDWLKDRHPGL